MNKRVLILEHTNYHSDMSRELEATTKLETELNIWLSYGAEIISPPTESHDGFSWSASILTSGESRIIKTAMMVYRYDGELRAKGDCVLRVPKGTKTRKLRVDTIHGKKDMEFVVGFCDGLESIDEE